MSLFSVLDTVSIIEINTKLNTNYIHQSFNIQAESVGYSFLFSYRIIQIKYFWCTCVFLIKYLHIYEIIFLIKRPEY